MSLSPGDVAAARVGLARAFKAEATRYRKQALEAEEDADALRYQVGLALAATFERMAKHVANGGADELTEG